MDDRSVESGRQFDLDKRIIVIAGALLLAICGSFFILGVWAGKRQWLWEESQTAGVSPIFSLADGKERDLKPANENLKSKAAKDNPEQLDWYKSVNGSAPIPAVAQPPNTVKPKVTTPEVLKSDGVKTEIVKPDAAKPDAEKKAARPSTPPVESAAKSKPQAIGAQPAPAGYTVQVGAFRKRQEADNKARMVRAKGYDCRIESPHIPEQLFLLKVGAFKTRAEAIAMQLRLKKSGFISFIKTN